MKPVPRREHAVSPLPLPPPRAGVPPSVDAAPSPHCRYCGREFASADRAEEHLRELAKAGMLLDHIAIHGPAAAAW